MTYVGTRYIDEVMTFRLCINDVAIRVSSANSKVVDAA